MSSSVVISDDRYVPIRRDGVECLEIASKKSGLRHVLVHPQDGRLMELDIKDHFVWECLASEVSIADIKQQYYQRFKVLPTQRIIELVREWHELGYLKEESPLWKACPEQHASRWGIRVPLLPIRMLLGPLMALFSSGMVVGVILGITVLACGALMFLEGPLVLHRPLETLSPPTLLLMMLCGAYLASTLKALFRIGALWRGQPYRKDYVQIGGWMCFPALFISERGFGIKEHQQVIWTRALEWVTPLTLALGLASWALWGPEFSFDDVSFDDGYLAMALGSSILFVGQSSPFLKGSLVKLCEACLRGPSLKELREAHRQSHTVFERDYGQVGARGLEFYMASVLIWVVAGCSYLLYTFASMADVLGRWGREAMGLGDSSQLFWQLMLYAPLLLFFFWMLWRCCEPFVLRLLSMSIWNEERLLAPVLAALTLALIPAATVMPPLLMRVGLSLLLIALWIKVASTDEKTSLVKIWPTLFPVLLGAALAQLVLPHLQEPLAWLFASLWLLWSFWVAKAQSPSAPMWWFKLGGAGVVLAVVLVVLLRLPLASAQLLLSIGAGLWLSLTFLTAVGQFGAQNIFGASASLCFLMAYSTSRVENAADMETFLSVGLALSLLPILGWQRVLVRQRSVWASAMVVDLENPERSMMETFGVACRRLHGSITFSDLRSAAPTVRKSIQNMELWFKGFALASDWDALERVGLSACQWDDRRSIEKDSDSQLLTSWERKGALKLDQRVKLLKAQMCFKGFPDEELHILADLLEVVPFEDGDHLIEQDQPAQPMLEIIVKGKAVLEKRLPGGRVSTMAELGPKETLCMEDLFRDGVHDNSAYAMSDGVLVRLYRQHLLTWGAQKEGRLAQVVSSVKLSETIMKLSLFKDFSSAQVRLVMEQLKQRKCSAGENVITQGEEGDEFYLLDRGGVDILIGENKVASLGEGSYFGEIALLEKCLRTATVRTNTNSSLYYLTQKDFDKFFASGRGAQVLKNVSLARGGDAS